MKSLFFIFYILFLASSLSAEVVDRIVAVVNEEVITASDVQELIAAMGMERGYDEEYSGEELAQLQQGALLKLINEKLVVDEAKSLGIEVEEREVENRLDETRKRFSDKGDFESVLQKEGLSIKRIKDRLRRQLLARRFIDIRVRRGIKIDPAEIDGYYERHKEKFVQPQQIRVANILLKIKESEDEVKKRMENIRKEILGGADFAKFASKYSEGPDASEGGDMGYLKRGDMIEQLDKAAFNMEEGEISDIIKTEFGFHILKVLEMREAQIVKIEEVKDRIREVLYSEKFQDAMEELLKELRERAYIVVK